MAEVGSTANKYEILAKLATGGMAEIFLARGVGSVGVARYVVLKRILREFASNKSFVRMFLDEARLVAQLQHPNIAQVHDVGQLGDSYFFTMEYVHGETVRALLSQSRQKRRDFPLGAVLAIVAGAAAGLHHAHEKLSLDGKPLGIVHRDVTPSNLMVSFEGNVKVVDFGVAKAGDSTGDTKSGTIKGKTSYLSPEQCKGVTLDRRSDLFSLGIVMWEMLTCERLFRRGSEFESMSAIVNEDAPPPSTVNPNVPPEIDALVGKLLHRDRDQRFANAQDVIDAVEDTAVAVKAKMSASVLVRMLRETFGHRPEPWIILEQQKIEAPTVTVTADINDSKEIQLHQLPGLELVDESGKRMGTESESGALDSTTTPLPTKPNTIPPPFSDDGDLAIPRAPVLPPRKDPSLVDDDDEASAPIAQMEDLPTSRWNVVVPPDLDLDKAIVTSATMPSSASGSLPPSSPPSPPPSVPRTATREGRLRTPVAGVPIMPPAEPVILGPAGASSGVATSSTDAIDTKRLPTGPQLPLDRDQREPRDRGTGPQQPLDAPTSTMVTPPPASQPIAIPRTRTPPPPPPSVARTKSPGVPIADGSGSLASTAVGAGTKPIPGDEATPTPTPTLVDVESARAAPDPRVTPDADAPTTTRRPIDDSPTTIEPQRVMPDPTPPPLAPMAQAAASGFERELDGTTVDPGRSFDDDWSIAPKPALKNPKVLAAIGGGLLLLIIVIVAATRGGEPTKAFAPDAAVNTLESLRADDAAVEPLEPKPPIVDAGVVAPRVDAGKPVAPRDAAVAVPALVDAGAAVVRPPPPKAKFTKADLLKLYEAAAYSSLVATCATGGIAVEPSVCVLGACRAGNEARAKQWLPLVPKARRGSLQTTCLTLGVKAD